MVNAGTLKAYVAKPLAFFQDDHFGSDIAGGRKAAQEHGISGVVCTEMEDFVRNDLELAFVAVVRTVASPHHREEQVES
jgi:hypothetical protein